MPVGCSVWVAQLVEHKLLIRFRSWSQGHWIKPCNCLRFSLPLCFSPVPTPFLSLKLKINASGDQERETSHMFGWRIRKRMEKIPFINGIYDLKILDRRQAIWRGPIKQRNNTKKLLMLRVSQRKGLGNKK